jgi:hypothetical protein
MAALSLDLVAMNGSFGSLLKVQKAAWLAIGWLVQLAWFGCLLFRRSVGTVS